jgi:hypothetical protein
LFDANSALFMQMSRVPIDFALLLGLGKSAIRGCL